MTYFKRRIAIPVIILTFFASQDIFAEELIIWHRRPASQWNEALPVGNGRLGAMVFGGLDHERIQLNEESIWTKEVVPVPKKGGYKAIPIIQNLLFEGKYKEAQQMCQDELILSQRPPNTYQTLGDINIQYSGVQKYNHVQISNYRHELQLDNALVKTTFNTRTAKHTRTVFSSAVDQVVVIMAEADEPGQISCTIELSRPGDGEQVIVQDGLMIMSQHINDGKGVRYETRVKVILHGGTMEVDGTKLRVIEADKMELRLVAATDYRGGEPSEMCEAYLSSFEKKSYDQILKDHLADHQKYFNRVSFKLPKTEAAGFATDERIYAQQSGVYDPSLTALYFQFGRYLLITSSRPGSLPANLQGIWADGLKPPWHADYHLNINIQMNYWPAEVTNLSEMHLPFLEFIGELRESGRITAREMYGVNGFTAHHTTDVWHYTTTHGGPAWAMWPMGVAWAATHIWEHYLYNQDKQFLRDYGYPVMREAAQFLSELMVKDPNTGKWITGPSSSPENVFLTPDGERSSVCMGPAMDLQIVWQLFNGCIEAAKVLGTDTRFRKKLESQLANLTPVKIGADGRILEWSAEDLDEALPGHRHMSHLYGLFPSNQYNWNDSPEFMEAAAKSIDYRLQHGGAYIGWSRAWGICFYARLMDSKNAWKNITALYSEQTLPNMFDMYSRWKIVQIDGNFGGVAGIAEILMQSHAGEVHLLPCLPDELPEGEINGLMARGGHEVNITWKNNILVEATITSKLGNPVKVKYGNKVVEFPMAKGEQITLNSDLKIIEQPEILSLN